MNLSTIRSNASDVKTGSELPDPPYRADIDLTPLPRMWFDPRHLLREDWLYELPAEAVRAKFILQLTSFHEVPAGSLPDRDGALQRMCGVDRATWQAIKADALSGWTLCSDGRWYCRYMEPQVLEAAGRREAKAKQLAELRDRKARKAAGGKSGEKPELISDDSSGDRAELRAAASSGDSLNTTATATPTPKKGSPAAAAGHSSWPGHQEDDRSLPGSETAGVWMSQDRRDRFRREYPYVPASAYFGKIVWLRNNAPSKPVLEELERLVANDHSKMDAELAKAKIKAEADAAPKKRVPLV